MTVPAMSLRDALAGLRAGRHPNDVVITTMGASREWMAFGPTHPLDFVLVPSAMGQAPSFGLGLALARPDRRIIVVNGDGSMLMNLGSLVTITAERPPNLILIVCDNGVYEVTGAQPSPGSAAGRAGGDPVDFIGFAEAAGFRSLFHYRLFADWQRDLAQVLNAPGPSFVVLEVASVPGIGGPRSPGPAAERARRFVEALNRREA